MYDFRTLSPLDFELLVRDLLQAETGIRFESFGPGQDLGKLMDEFGVKGLAVEEQIELRREELTEEEEDYDASFEPTKPTKSPGQMSDDEIRSMFADLRKEESNT